MSEGILNPIQQLQADFDFDVYTKQEVDTLLDGKADKVDTYTKTEADALLNEKAGKSTTLAGYGITDAYTKTQTDNLLNGKVDTNSVYTKEETDNLLSVKANSADVYTKTETNNLLSAKADSANVYTKTESNTLLAGKANVDDVYTKTEIDNQLTVTKDGTWVKGTQTTATNLEKLEGGIEYLYGLLSYKYSQLRKYINGNYYDYETDTDSAYTKSVPSGAMPYAGLEKLGGKTVVWNQAEPVISSADWEQYASTYTSVSFSDGVATITVINDSSSSGYRYGFGRKTAHSIISGHVYIFLYDIRSNNAGTSFSDETISTNGGFTNVATNANQWYSFCSIQTANKSTTKCLIKPLNNRAGLIFDVRNVMLIDLTLLYGSGNEPSTVEEFQQMFPASYYPYNAGELLSAGVTEVESVGINLFDKSTAQVGYIRDSDGTQVTGTAAADASLCTGYISVQPNTSYYFLNNTPNGNWGAWYDINKTFISGFAGLVTRTSPANAYYVRMTIRYNNNVGSPDSFCLNKSNASYDGNYYPYNGHTYPIPTEIQSLEGYGWSAGSVYNYIDYERKVFVKCVGAVDLGTLNWAYGYNRFSADVPNMNSTTTTRLNGLTCIYPIDTNSYIDENMTDKTCKRYAGKVLIKDSAYTTTSAFTSAMNGVYLYYELATPIETDIGEYLTDDNIIEVESGGTLTFENVSGDNYRIPVPSTEEYMINLQEAVSNG